MERLIVAIAVIWKLRRVIGYAVTYAVIAGVFLYSFIVLAGCLLR